MPTIHRHEADISTWIDLQDGTFRTHVGTFDNDSILYAGSSDAKALKAKTIADQCLRTAGFYGSTGLWESNWCTPVRENMLH